jgi:hypothetical protein
MASRHSGLEGAILLSLLWQSIPTGVGRCRNGLRTTHHFRHSQSTANITHMQSQARKRKQAQTQHLRSQRRHVEEDSDRVARSWDHATNDALTYDPALYVQAHEAEVIRGPHAWSSCRALEIGEAEGESSKKTELSEGLVRWDGGGQATLKQDIWIDRCV